MNFSRFFEFFKILNFSNFFEFSRFFVVFILDRYVNFLNYILKIICRESYLRIHSFLRSGDFACSQLVTWKSNFWQKNTFLSKKSLRLRSGDYFFSFSYLVGNKISKIGVATNNYKVTRAWKLPISCIIDESLIFRKSNFSKIPLRPWSADYFQIVSY